MNAPRAIRANVKILVRMRAFAGVGKVPRKDYCLNRKEKKAFSLQFLERAIPKPKLRSVCGKTGSAEKTGISSSMKAPTKAVIPQLADLLG
jgi:hypothetical protein